MTKRKQAKGSCDDRVDLVMECCRQRRGSSHTSLKAERLGPAHTCLSFVARSHQARALRPSSPKNVPIHQQLGISPKQNHGVEDHSRASKRLPETLQPSRRRRMLRLRRRLRRRPAFPAVFCPQLPTREMVPRPEKRTNPESTLTLETLLSVRDMVPHLARYIRATKLVQKIR